MYEFQIYFTIFYFWIKRKALFRLFVSGVREEMIHNLHDDTADSPHEER